MVPVSTPAGVKVEGLAKAYGSVRALREVSFEVGEGQVFGLLGPNGAGKTTALECILGLRVPDAGTIGVAGFDLLADPGVARLRLGAQIQGASLQDKISPREALDFFGSFYPVSAAPDELLRQFGLEEKADSAFETLSAGQRQRLFLALALINKPAVVILDEPTAGLDPSARQELRGLIQSLRRAGKTILLSTHDLEDAELLCDTVAIMDQGRLLACGSPMALVQRYGRRARVEFRPTRYLPAGWAPVFPGAGEWKEAEGCVSIPTEDPGATIAELVAALGREGNSLADLKLVKGSLEQVFLTLTGHSWRGGQ